jgi:hypothetical protein
MFRGLPDTGMMASAAEPIAGILAVRYLGRAARKITCRYVRQTHEDGHTWHEIDAALDLGAKIEHTS